MKKLVLDKGSIEIIDQIGTDESIIRSAHISYIPTIKFEHKDLLKNDKKFLDHVVKNDHWPQFNHTALSFKIKMPLFIALEWTKYQLGFNRTYIKKNENKEDPEFYLPTFLTHSKSYTKELQFLLTDINMHFERASHFYDKLLNNGVDQELAKIILPQSLYVEFIEIGSLPSYARLYKLRSKKTHSKEIKTYMFNINKLINLKFPISWPIIKKYTLFVSTESSNFLR